MTFSFIMIAYNEEKVIKRSLESILSLNGLTDFEILVINDSSSDKTAEVVSHLASTHPEIHLVTNKNNMGRGYSRNLGVSKAIGKYISFIDADIIIPRNWLTVCMSEIVQYDAVGGIAAPDGDSCFVYRLFKLKPKIVNHTVSVSGGNGLFKKSVFSRITFDKNMRDGEDVDMFWKLNSSGIKSKSIPTLICEHNEHKSFLRTLIWMFEQGAGANRLFARFKKVRLPDITFFVFLAILSTSFLLATRISIAIFLPLLFCLSVSAIHIQKKFYFQLHNAIGFLLAAIVHSAMIAAYLIGRTSNVQLLFL